jgi:plastocyanin
VIRRLVLPATIVAVAAMSLVACGGGDDVKPYVEPKGPPVATLEVSAKNFAFTPDTLESPEAGIIAIELTSTQGIHDFVIEGVPGFAVDVSGGQTATNKVELEAGEYTFYCSIPGHRSAGMEGTLTVG